MNEIVLGHGSHDTREQGMCAMEFVAWVANEPHTDRPTCVAEFFQKFTVECNDNMPPGVRQRLRPYLGRMIGTASDGTDAARAVVAIAVVDAIDPECFLRDYMDDELLHAQWGELGWDVAAAIGGVAEDDERAWRWVFDFLDMVLPTEELPEITAAIREKCAA